MTLFEKIEEISTDPVQLTNFLIQLDSWLEYLHNNNFYIYDFKPKKIVYISCNPSTLVRDLCEFETDYELTKIKPVDMFPFTSHVEVCALLELKNCQ